MKNEVKIMTQHPQGKAGVNIRQSEIRCHERHYSGNTQSAGRNDVS